MSSFDNIYIELNVFGSTSSFWTFLGNPCSGSPQPRRNQGESLNVWYFLFIYDKLPLNISFAYYPYYYCRTINKRISSHAQSFCNIGCTSQHCLCFFSCGTICSLSGDWSCFVVKPGFNPECILSVFQDDQLQCNNGLCISLEKRWKFFKHITKSINLDSCISKSVSKGVTRSLIVRTEATNKYYLVIQFI